MPKFDILFDEVNTDIFYEAIEKSFRLGLARNIDPDSLARHISLALLRTAACYRATQPIFVENNANEMKSFLFDAQTMMEMALESKAAKDLRMEQRK